ncbi:hypothetical protein MKK75_07430 [Methylobacterium sp. J-030]|uniref:hypothetical protein n=1 Tax=Methylobacterium sp. J-030 TaxID=2836627 RepID=UPI001FB92385|nr:hypothetical protein [Methylobacterium sp. J-030]MCJ2068632.1 hypothetical protein [Methylobacterium sp. J-030]
MGSRFASFGTAIRYELSDQTDAFGHQPPHQFLHVADRRVEGSNPKLAIGRFHDHGDVDTELPTGMTSVLPSMIFVDRDPIAIASDQDQKVFIPIRAS